MNKSQIEQVKETFKQQGWVLIENVLDHNAAMKVKQCMIDHNVANTWYHASQVFDNPHTIYVNDIPMNMARVAANRSAASMPTDNPNKIRYSFVRTVDEKMFKSEMFQKVHFTTMHTILDIVKNVLDTDAITFESTYGIKLSTGDFLDPHTDVGNEQRLVSFNFDLTEGWKPEFGGNVILMKGGNPKPIFQPFNSILILDLRDKGFATRTSMVTNQVHYPKLSLFGWVKTQPEIYIP